MRLVRHVAAVLPLVGCAAAAEVLGFKANPPDVPSQNEDLVIEHLWQFSMDDPPVKLAFVPGTDGMVVTAHKTGFMRLYQNVDADVNDYKTLIDMRADVFSFGDHGLLSFAFHPDFEKGVKKAFLHYTGEPKDVSVLPNDAAITPNRPQGWGLGPPETTGYTWGDICPCLDCDGTGPNHYGNICEHPYYIDRVAVDLDAGTFTKEVTLLNDVCGSASSHGPGTLIFINGDLVASNGDGSQFAEFDPGFPEDGCYVPDAGADQGCFRAQRMDLPYANGKIMRVPAALLDSAATITLEQVEFISRGNRQPFRMFYHEPADQLWIADVGLGDGGTTERIFTIPDVSKAPGAALNTNPAHNWGWPCIEGVYSSAQQGLLHEYNLWDTPSEQERLAYLQQNGLATCDGIKAAALALVAGTTPLPADADETWMPPFYEYRVGALDPNFPDLCVSGVAALTNVFVYDGASMPEAYTGKLLFSDYVKQCIWMFDQDPATGQPDTSRPPHIVTANLGLIDMVASPVDDAIYGIDFTNTQIVRMYARGKGPAGQGPTPPPTAAPTMAPFALPTDIPDAAMCFDAATPPELGWRRRADGSYEGDLTLGVVNVATAAGTMRTRAWNGMIPGPLMRMEPCGVYHINVFNDQAEFPDTARDYALNTMGAPTHTNLHVHGLHVSGESPGDDSFVTIEPGATQQYTIAVPCDHSSGSNWYHPHHHGSVAIQTEGGAAGLLVVGPSPTEASGTPNDIQALPEQFIAVQEIVPAKLTQYAGAAHDTVFATNITDPFLLVNGCAAPAPITLEAGQWTRLHLLNVALEFNSVFALTTKDGVPVSDAPRAVDNNLMFMSIASRLDVAVRCPAAAAAGPAYALTYAQIGNAAAPAAPQVLAAISVVVSARAAAPDLPAWNPCRPAYLMDAYNAAPGNTDRLVPLDVRNNLNGYVFKGPGDYFMQLTLGRVQPWSVSGADVHPLHIHVNHMQIGAEVTDDNQWLEVPNWSRAGDWVDVLSQRNGAIVYVRPVTFSGPMVMHCHIAEHSDLGVIGVAKINGQGQGPVDSPAVTNHGTCPKDVPLSTPFKNTHANVPGIIQAEHFDNKERVTSHKWSPLLTPPSCPLRNSQAEHFDNGGEGIAYHNFNTDTNAAANPLRPNTAVETVIIPTAAPAAAAPAPPAAAYVTAIRGGEWLRWSVNVPAPNAGGYALTLSIAAATPVPLEFTLWLDSAGCPPSEQAEGRLVALSDANYGGSGGAAAFAPYAPQGQPFALPPGPHALTLCFDGADTIVGADTGLALDSLTLTRCGASAAACAATGSNAPPPPQQPPQPTVPAKPTAAPKATATAAPADARKATTPKRTRRPSRPAALDPTQVPSTGGAAAAAAAAAAADKSAMTGGAAATAAGAFAAGVAAAAAALLL
ncbi:hypothetical protein JKP88DRAFT_263405 [Tribonema minus]|uniref:Multicopper oxidase n=1 Tax=Tribonema minus TaxID=303371 RepID=A0A835YVH6_9STRA|nr:hypothetical protein JKP88DRAFT_263405 [Tribonema minus]